MKGPVRSVNPAFQLHFYALSVPDIERDENSGAGGAVGVSTDALAARRGGGWGGLNLHVNANDCHPFSVKNKVRRLTGVMAPFQRQVKAP